MFIHPQLKVLGHFVLPPSVCLSIPPHIACTGMCCLPSSSYSSQARSCFFLIFLQDIYTYKKGLYFIRVMISSVFHQIMCCWTWAHFFILLLYLLTPLFNFLFYRIFVHVLNVCIIPGFVFTSLKFFSYSQTYFSDHLY